MADVVTWKVEAAFTTDPLDPSPVWEDLSDRLRAFPGFSSNRGRSGEFQENEAGTCTIPLDNQDGELTPANTSGTWFGQLLPNRLVRISATYDGDEFWQFTGLIEAYEQIVEPGSPDQVCLLRVVDGFKILNLERVPQFPDYPEEVERVLDPVWGYWRLNEKPATRIKPGGWVKVKDNKDKDKKPQRKWRKKKRQRFLASASGVDAQVIGNPAFLQSTSQGGDSAADGPILGELTYGIRFDKGMSQHLRVPVPEADDRPGAENCVTVSCMVRPGQNSDTEEGILVGGPMIAAATAPAWWLELVGQEAQFNVLVTGGLVVCVTTGDAVPRDGGWHHIVATFRSDTGVSQIFVDGVRQASQDTLDGTVPATQPIRRGDTGAPIFIGGHPTYQTALGGGTSEYFTGMLAEVVVSEHKFPNEATSSPIQALADCTSAGYGVPGDTDLLSGTRIGLILAQVTNRALDPIAEVSFYNADTGNTDIDAGEVLVQPQRMDETRLELLRRVEEAENGMLFVATDGTLTFRDNAWFEAGDGADVFATLASDGVGIDFQGIAPVTNDDMLWPVVTVTREGGEAQTVGDPTAFFGQPQEISDTLHTTDAAALSLATKLQERFGQSRSRISSLSLNALSNPLLYPIVLGAELGNRVQVAHTYPDGTVEDFDLRIIGISRNSSGIEHTATWTLAPSYYPTVAEWYLGVPGFSELQTTTTLA